MDVKFREATVEDYSQIKDLSKGIYENSDTLLCSFINWLKSDKWFLFVGEVNEDKLIAFTAVQVTDGMEGLTLRKSRVEKAYRGRGLFRAIVRYSVRYVRERVQNARYAYRMQVSSVKAPDGCEIIKELDLVTVVLDDNTARQMEKSEFARSNSRSLTWNELKELYESKYNVKCMFGSELLEIDGDIFRLSCEANWRQLEGRVETRVMLTEDERSIGRVETGISFLKLEHFFTNDGVPVVTMNMYGVRKDALKCHIAKGVLESNRYVGGGRYLLLMWSPRGALQECMSFLTEVSGCEVSYSTQMSLFRGEFCKKLQDV